MTSQVVVVDGAVYLIDAGYGTLMRMAELEIPLKNLHQVFITHQHADHIMDLPALMVSTWSDGVSNEIKVFGPQPMEQVIDGAIGAYKQDYEIRGKGGRFKPTQEVFVPKNLQSNNGEIVTIYEDDLLKVSAIDVPHTVVPLAFAFRFDSKDRSIVISGDTKKSDNVVKIAEGADVLVHEALYWPGILEMVKKRRGAMPAEEYKNYFLKQHTTSEDAGAIATKAGVKTLVLNHLISGPAEASDEEWIAATQKTFGGKIIVGRDKLVI